MRTTTVRYRDWTLRARLAERLYRLSHRGRARTVVVSGDRQSARWDKRLEQQKPGTTEDDGGF
jgi:hypothetical protein